MHENVLIINQGHYSRGERGGGGKNYKTAWVPNTTLNVVEIFLSVQKVSYRDCYYCTVNIIVFVGLHLSH